MSHSAKISKLILLAAGVLLAPPLAKSEVLTPIEVVGERAFTESIAATSDGTLYVSSLASGGIARAKPGAAKTETWIAPGAFGTRSTFGVFADQKSNTLWVCSNDVSSLGVPGPSSVPGAYLKGFDLTTGVGKVSAKLPGAKNLCNDMTVADDGTLYVTDSLTPQILTLKPGADQLEVWAQNNDFQPENGAGLDGVAIGGDGDIYVNTFNGGAFFRVERKNGKAGAVTKLRTSRPLKLPDGLRLESGQTFMMVEGSGTLDRIYVDGDTARVETLKDGLNEPVSFARVGDVAWVAEGQLSRLFGAKDNGPPKLPFEVVPVQVAR